MRGVKMRSSYLAYGLLGMLCVNVAVVACGSEDDKKSRQAEDGGNGGAAGATPNDSGGGSFQPAEGGGAGEQPGAGGNGGTPSEGGVGGAGAPPTEMTGGAGGAEPGNSLPPLPAVNCDPITFQDANLESAVRYLVGKATGDVTAADVAELTSLDASDANITTLGGIECLVNLESARFNGGEIQNHIADVGPLRYLSQLTSLDLSNNPVTDLSPLVYLTNLSDLWLDDMAPIPELTPLRDLPSLRALSITYGTLSKPESLNTLTNIRELIGTATIDDASLVGSLTQLQHLELGYLALTNPNELSKLANLTYLDVLDMGLTSAAPFAALTELVHLDLRESPILDLGPLQNLTGLHELGLFACSATDIKPLVDNQGLSSGDVIDISNMPLDCVGQETNTSALVDRGVTLTGNPCTN